MFNKVLCSFLCGCLVFMGLSASGGNIQIKTDHNAIPSKALKKSDSKSEKTVNSDDDPYNYVVHNSGDPAPDELNYFIKGTDADWMADFLQNHNDINYCLVLDKENNPVGVMGPYNLNSSANFLNSSLTTKLEVPKSVPADVLKKNKSKNVGKWLPWVLLGGGVLSLIASICFFVKLSMLGVSSKTKIMATKCAFGGFAFLTLMTVLIIACIFIWTNHLNKTTSAINLNYILKLKNNNNWTQYDCTSVYFQSEDKYYNYDSLYIYPKQLYREKENFIYFSEDYEDLFTVNYRAVHSDNNNSNVYYSPWEISKINNPETAHQSWQVNSETDYSYSSVSSCTDSITESGSDIYGLENSSFSAKFVHDKNCFGEYGTKEYTVNIGGGEEKGLTAAPAESFFMFWLNNQASSDLPYNVHFVSTTDDINGGYFILPQISEMNWNTSDDHIPVPNANIFDPNDYTFENIADNENVTPYYEKDKNPGYDYMQITQYGKYCVFPIGFTGKDNSSSSTLEVWISPKNGTAEDSYIHVGNIKAQYSSSDSQWHFTYTPVSTPSGWNVTAEKSDITGTSKEDMLSGTTLDNFGLSIVQENSPKMAIQ